MKPWLIPALGLVLLAGCKPEPVDRALVPYPSSVPDSSKPAPTPLVEPGREDYPLFGFSLKPPKDWYPEPVPQPVHYAARWLPDNSPETDVSQFTVNVAPATTDSFDQLVASFRVPEGYRSERIKIDGVDALEVRHPEMGLLVAGKNPPVGPYFLSLHNGCAYKIAFLLDSRDEIVAARGVINSWRWLPPATAFEQLRLLTDVQMFGGKGKLQLPAAAREEISLQTPTSTSFIVYDYGRQQDALVLGAELVSVPDRTIEEQAIKYAEQIEKATQLNALLSFAPLEGNPNVQVSDFLTGEFPSEQGTVKRHSRYAVWRVGPGEFIHLQFVVNDELLAGEGDQLAANAAIDAILKSCQSKD